MNTRAVKMETLKINATITREMVEDLKGISGYDFDIEKELEELIRKEKIKLRRNKIEKITKNIL